MALNVSNPAELRLLTILIAAWGTLDVRLFKNNYTPDDTSTAANFTPADYSGAVTENPTWGTPATDGSGRAYTLSDTLSFPVASSGTQTVYGWYATDAGGNYLFGMRFGSAVTVSTTVKVDDFAIKFTLRQEP
jgi:hypothetical protein